jgi:hypothetical protein
MQHIQARRRATNLPMNSTEGQRRRSAITRLRSPAAQDWRGVDLISDALPFGRLWYEDVSAAVEYAKHRSRSHHAVIPLSWQCDRNARARGRF